MLTQYRHLVPISNNVEVEWSNIRNLLEKLGHEVLRRKLLNTQKRGLKLWNEEVKQGLQKKKEKRKI